MNPTAAMIRGVILLGVMLTSSAGAASLADDGLRPIGAVTTDIEPDVGAMPDNVAAGRFVRAGYQPQPSGFNRPWMESNYAWVAPGVYHHPLYFDDVNLERYGYHLGALQPVLSAAHFFGRLPAIPYMLGACPPKQPIYTLGYGRPGSRVPHVGSRPPLSLRGALYQAGAVTGLIYLIP